MAAAAVAPLTRGERVCAFIERHCIVPEGALRGQRMHLEPFQRKFILAVYDNPAGTRRAILSIGRKNGKTALIAAIVLCHIAGPEAVENSQIISGARSREQAALVFNLAVKMVRFSTDLQRVIRIVPTTKRLLGLALNVEYRAISAEGKTAHGLSPVVGILDELGQVRGPSDEFVDAITTAQGAYRDPLLFVISTQAANDADMLSVWIDNALGRGVEPLPDGTPAPLDPQTICHLYEAHRDCALLDEQAWRDSNPALGVFRTLEDLKAQATNASRMPGDEPRFRNLILNQRVETSAPLISRNVWLANSHEPELFAFEVEPVFCGLDLSFRHDLTAFVRLAWSEVDGQKSCNVKAIFWTPRQGLNERAKRDRQPYAQWAEQGFLRVTDRASVDFDEVARDIAEDLEGCNVGGIAFDRWGIDQMRKSLEEVHFDTEKLVPWGQGYRDMSPAIAELESVLLNAEMCHGNNPVLTMCAANAVGKMDEAGGRKLDKIKATGRIDGIVALAMALGLAARHRIEGIDLSDFLNNPVIRS